jgi:hypothetical protein
MANKYEKRTISAPQEGSFTGSRGVLFHTVSIPLEDGEAFTFGDEKARSIVRHFEAIKAFASKHPAQAKVTKADVAAAIASMSAADLEKLIAAAGKK